MSAHIVVPSLLNSCLDYHLARMDSLSDQGFLHAFSTLANSTIDYVFHHLLCRLVDMPSFERVIRFIRLFGSKISQLQLSLKTNRIEGPPELLEAIGNRMVAALTEHLDGNVIRLMDMYDYPLFYEMNDFCQMFRGLNGLTSIRLIVHDMDDRIIEAISFGCPDLRELYLLGTQFSSQALRLLAPDEESNDKVATRAGCRKLRHFVLYQTIRTSPKFTSACLAHLIVQLKDLTRMEIANTVLNRAFIVLMATDSTTRLHITTAEVDFSNWQFIQDLQHNADTIRQFVRDCAPHRSDIHEQGGTEDIKVDFLRGLACLMPQLAKLTLTLATVSELASMHFLSQYRKLTFLRVTVDFNANDPDPGSMEELTQIETCEIGLRQMLAKFASLTQLELMNLPGVDVNAIARACPRLEQLDISNVKLLRYSWEASHLSRFAHLNQLIVCGHSDYTVDDNALLEFLADCPNLEFLTLAWVSQLGDDFIADLLARNPMPALNRIEFHELSNTFTITAIRQVVLSRPGALVLNVFGCSGVTNADILALGEEIRARNRNIKLKYHQI